MREHLNVELGKYQDRVQRKQYQNNQFNQKSNIESAVQSLKEIFEQAFTTKHSSNVNQCSRQISKINTKDVSPIKNNNKKINLYSPKVRAKTQNEEQIQIPKPQSVIYSTKSLTKIKWTCLNGTLTRKVNQKCITEMNNEDIGLQQKQLILKKIGCNKNSRITVANANNVSTNYKINKPRLQTWEKQRQCFDNENNENRQISICKYKMDKKLSHIKNRDNLIVSFDNLKSEIQHKKRQINNKKQVWIVLQKSKKQNCNIQTDKFAQIYDISSPINKLLQVDIQSGPKFFKK